MLTGIRSLWILLAAFAGLEAAAQSPSRKLLIVDIDDLGLELLQATPTPHLDSLAIQGRYYPRFYTSPMCTPTRALFQLGARGSRPEVRCTGNVSQGNSYRLPTTPFTPLATRVRAAGRTAMKIGKWHLSPNDALLHPNAHGWLPYAGAQGNLNPWGGTWFNYPENLNGTLHWVSNTYLTTRETNLGIRAVLDGYDLISLSYHAPHQPFHNPPSSLHTFNLPLVGERKQAQAALQAVDTELARLTPLALALGYTVIIYSDNGLAGSLGGLKGTVYEGGVRTMLWAIGPGVLPGVDNSLIEMVDIYATVLEILGISQGPLDGPDSVSFAPLLQGTGTPPLVVVAQRGGPAGVDPHTQNHLWRRMAREDRYKLIVNQDVLRSRLFDLWNDPEEQTDLLLAGPLSPQAALAYDLLRTALTGL
ncbi:MAG TPA: hypothetical protein EYQ25_13730 [Planctomycetes bacterium]|nr:hypothetical protein [Planctomycetota bacterium]HIL38525.1 hypothetical protein [Planctomycetota bacterium]